MQFARLDGRAVVADFGGGVMTSDAGALLLSATDRAIGLVDRFAACYSDGRTSARVVHDVATLVGQRVFGSAPGHEDLIDHDALRHDPVLGVVLGRLEAKRAGCAPVHDFVERLHGLGNRSSKSRWPVWTIATNSRLGRQTVGCAARPHAPAGGSHGLNKRIPAWGLGMVRSFLRGAYLMNTFLYLAHDSHSRVLSSY